MKLHEQIRQARKARGLTQEQLAALAGIKRKELALLESGRDVTLKTLFRVLAQLPNLPVLHLTPEELLLIHGAPETEHAALGEMIAAARRLLDLLEAKAAIHANAEQQA